jgi:heme-degrading monooxygenase HmoA
MIVTVFRCRIKEEARAEYLATAARMAALAETMPGFRSRKTFVAEDGERLVLVEFEDEAAQRNWSVHPEHVVAKKLGRERFYAEYRIQVCPVARESAFPKP